MTDDQIADWLDDLGQQAGDFDVLPPLYHRAAELVRATVRAAQAADELEASAQLFDRVADNARAQGRTFDEGAYLLIRGERQDAANKIREALRGDEYDLATDLADRGLRACCGQPTERHCL